MKTLRHLPSQSTRRSSSQKGLISLALLGSSAAAIAALFSIYVWSSYGQLKKAFNEQTEFVPTRFYSDLTRIAPPQTRAQIDARLKALHYLGETGFENTPDALRFKLHAADYPMELLPNGHTQEAGQPIELAFDGQGPEASLHVIKLAGTEVPELYLEPELIATLARGGASAGASANQIRTIVKFGDIPASVWKAILAIEDQHFLEHSGIDPRGFARAILVNLRTLSFAQGGSTITQQLVKNLLVRRTKNIFRKFNELFLALLLETTFDKERILERYLNEVYLGQIGNLEIHGVAEGASYFFGKDLADLSVAESALMAGLIRGPAVYSPYRYRERAIERQRLVLKKMFETGQIAQEELDAALATPIRLAPPQTGTNKAPYFTDFVKAELLRKLKDRASEQEISQMGYRVYTTLDPAVNKAGQDAVASGIATLEKNLKLDPNSPARLEGALAAVDHRTGYIRALIGGRSYAQSTFNRILNMKRQVGSTFKPVVYLSALRKGTDAAGVPYGPNYPVEDAPWTLTYDRGRQTWSPHNYDPGFRGWIPLRTALAHSINTVAARIGMDVGLDQIINTARALAIESELPAVPSLTLGVAELSPVELLRMYAALANHGSLDKDDRLTVIRAIISNDGARVAWYMPEPQSLIDPIYADWITSIMQNVFTEGTAVSAAALGFDRPAAGKTGTTSAHRDAWFAGYTPQLTAVVWVGYDQDERKDELKAPDTIDPKTGKKIKPPKKPLLTGANAALPIWVNFMKGALEGEPVAPFEFNPALVRVPIDLHTGQRASSSCPTDQVTEELYPEHQQPDQSTCESDFPAHLERDVKR